jgi:hypothetical protein
MARKMFGYGLGEPFSQKKFQAVFPHIQKNIMPKRTILDVLYCDSTFWHR